MLAFLASTKRPQDGTPTPRQAQYEQSNSTWSSWLTDQVADATGVDVSGVVAGVSGVGEQLTGALASVSGDLQEFVDTVQTDTSETVTEIQTAIEEGAASDQGITLSTVSGAMGNIVGSISSGLREDGTATDRGRRNKGGRSGDGDGPVTYDRAEAQLRAVQRDRKTYLTDPQGDEDAYHAWCEQFDLHARTEEISQLLSTDEVVQKLHAELIPGKVSYNLFWHRYFYSIHGLKVAEDKRLALQQQQQPAEMIKPGQETVEAVPDAAAGEVPTKSQPAQETEAQSALLPSEPAAAAAAAVSQQENGKGEESISVSPPSPALTSPPLLVVEKDADPLPKVVGEKDSASTPAVEDNYEDDGADKEEVPNVVTAADEAPSGERKDGEDWDDWE
eukprot:gene10299-10744_t